MLQAQADAYGDGLDQSTAPPVHVAAQAALLRLALLQLAVHVRAAVRARAVRQVPATTPSASGPATTTLLSRAGMDTAEELGGGVRPRRHRRGVLDGQPRRRAAPASPSTTGSRGDLRPRRSRRCRRCAPVAVRRRAATSSAELLDGQPALPRRPGVGRAVRAARRARRVDEPAQALRGRARRAPARSRCAGHRVGRATTGDTVKFLWELDGGSRIETVLMLYPDRATVCVSSQAGCAMACGFCATGQAGFTRHLTAGEIVEQVVRATRAGPRRSTAACRNVVFMGMGEPLANEAAVWARGRADPRRPRPVGAPHHDQHGRRSCRASARSPPARCRSTWPSVLHAANDTLRDELVPINRRYPIDDADRRLPRVPDGQRTAGSASSGR